MSEAAVPSTIPASAFAWPVSEDAIRFVVRSTPDATGRCRLRAMYWQDGRRKLLDQTRADLEAHVRQAEDEGLQVEIVEAIPVRRAA